jgi:F-type H+-transporting ATPase subunit a
MKVNTINYRYINANPLDQFDIHNILSLDLSILDNLQVSITNIGLYLCLAFLIILMLYVLPNFSKVVSNKWFIGLESLYATIHSIVRNQINSNRGQIYFPFIFILFIFLLINNLTGMIPYSFASTSHIILTFALSFTIV